MNVTIFVLDVDGFPLDVKVEKIPAHFAMHQILTLEDKDKGIERPCVVQNIRHRGPENADVLLQERPTNK